MSTQLSPQIVAQAADWFLKFRTAGVAVTDHEEFLCWLQQSPQHVQAYFEEARMYLEAAPLAICDRVANRADEPCSAAPTRRRRNSAER